MKAHDIMLAYDGHTFSAMPQKRTSTSATDTLKNTSQACSRTVVQRVSEWASPDAEQATREGKKQGKASCNVHCASTGARLFNHGLCWEPTVGTAAVPMSRKLVHSCSRRSTSSTRPMCMSMTAASPRHRRRERSCFSAACFRARSSAFARIMLSHRKMAMPAQLRSPSQNMARVLVCRAVYLSMSGLHVHMARASSITAR